MCPLLDGSKTCSAGRTISGHIDSIDNQLFGEQFEQDCSIYDITELPWSESIIPWSVRKRRWVSLFRFSASLIFLGQPTFLHELLTSDETGVLVRMLLPSSLELQVSLFLDGQCELWEEVVVEQYFRFLCSP